MWYSPLRIVDVDVELGEEISSGVCNVAGGGVEELNW